MDIHITGSETLKLALWRRVLLNDPCVSCGSKSKALDHIHPQNYGGTDDWPNQAPACSACNGMKTDGTLMWMLWRLHEKRHGRFRRRVIGYRTKHGGVREPIVTALEY